MLKFRINKNTHSKFKLSRLAILPVLIMLISGCAGVAVNFKTLPQPTQTNKLRVFVLPLSAPLVDKKGNEKQWKISQQEFEQKQYENVAKFLEGTGIYEVVAAKEVRETIGNDEIPYWKWHEDNYTLAKQAAKAMYADYVVLLERGRHIGSKSFYWEMIIVNVGNENTFRAIEYTEAGDLKAYRRIIRRSYRKLFGDAKKDMLETAMRKGGGAGTKDHEKTITESEKSTKPAKETVVLAKQPVVEDKKPPQPVEDSPEPFKTIEEALGTDTKESGKPRIVVYDLDTVPQFHVAALILTEALREEIYKLQRFTIVDRENIAKVLEELKLQQSGFVDETQALEIGKWLAANEAVTGKIGILGSSMLMYAKRVDLKTLSTLNAGSLKCQTGKEEELLNAMPELAKKLIETQ